MKLIPKCPKCGAEAYIFKKEAINRKFYNYQCKKCHHLYNAIKPTASLDPYVRILSGKEPNNET
jgi:transposase-like protein